MFIKGKNPSASFTSVGYLILLIALACIGNAVKVSLFFGVDLLFGSVFVLLILRLYGFKWGLIASILASSVTIFLWNHPYGMIAFILETVFIGAFYRGKIGNSILLTALYWMILGTPLIWFGYHVRMDMNTTATILVILKDAVNGIFNAWMATLLYTYFPSPAWPGAQARKSKRHFYDILFMIFTGLIIFPLLVVTVIFGWQEYHKTDREIRDTIERQSEIIRNDIVGWRITHLQAIEQLAVIASGEQSNDRALLQKLTANLKRVFPDFRNIYIADAAGTTIAFDPIQNEEGLSNLGLNYADRSYFKQSKSSLRPVITDVFWGRGGVSEPIVSITAPIVDGGRFKGIVSGALNLRYIKNRIETLTQNDRMDITIVDRNRQVIASTRNGLHAMQPYDWKQGGDIYELADGLYQWFPDNVKNPMTLWGKSGYVKLIDLSADGSRDWTIVVESKVAPYRDALYSSYIKILSVLLLFGLIAIAAAILLSRLIIRPISGLADATTDLPGKIADNKPFNWPETLFHEISVLTANFKSMSEKLKTMFAEIRHLAYYDSLTGLPNRVLFNQELEHVLEQSSRENYRSAVLFIDLDRFKVVNDTLGHRQGDRLLQQVALRLQSCIGPKDILSRMGGDEFTAVIPQTNREQMTLAAQKILDAFILPFDQDGHEMFITPSIGISLYPDDGREQQELIKRADQAMYAAKEKGKNMYHFFTAEMSASSSNKMVLDTMLHKALEHDEFELHYQPKMNLRTNSFTGLETLIRWRHPQRGWISPAEFIPVAEETGMINPIGEWVLRTACAQNKAWQNAGYTPFAVSVNLSVRQLREQNLLELVPQILKETGLKPQYLELEITENLSMHNMDYALSILHKLKKLGVKIAMDDFGTGYSSLSYLKKFPIDHLKIDQSFIRDIQSEDDLPIVNAIISMAHSLGMIVIAEGVETDVQAQLLHEMKCDEIQGYLVSRPLPAEHIEKLFTAKDWHTSSA
ncbi:EAL domain-containing protein [Paenibacillus darwinianus]|uniref:EAL domain-containing protein n=1 Tax=Paenibacillus darwinianus TaxID=1380763 RepID=UPI00068D2ACC|nr:EAL domain-containing protein [Paenibacillus darwinianus]